jgi:hypothetical protein
MQPSLERLAEWNKPERSSIDAFNPSILRAVGSKIDRQRPSMDLLNKDRVDWLG